MYWKNTGLGAVFYREKRITAKKEHKCSECGKTIKASKKYYYSVGLWYDDCGDHFGTYKMCLQCKKDWDKILEIFRRKGEDEASCVFGLLKQAIEDALNAGFLTARNQLVKRYLTLS